MADPDIEAELAAAKPNFTVPLQSAKGVRPVRINWIWPGWLAQGKFHILAGEKTAGKSTTSFDWAATVTSGGRWPDGELAEQGDVLIWSAEDDFKDTILPRFIVAGGDPGHLYHVDHTVFETGATRSFDPATDMIGLEHSARHLPNLKLIIVDPVVMAVAGDSHKNAETRRGLQPLVDMANRCGAALVGITHFTKGTDGKHPVERVTGSLAFSAIARIVLAEAKDEENNICRLVRVASNIGPSGGGFEYTTIQELLPEDNFTAQRILWGDRLEGSAKLLLDGFGKQTETMKAGQWLENSLAEAPESAVKVTELKAAALANGVAWRTVERAKADMKNIKAEKHGDHWVWHRVAGTDFEPLAEVWTNNDYWEGKNAV
jgi:putative DNA primase/helicase